MKILNNHLDCAIDANIVLFKETLTELIELISKWGKKKRYLKYDGDYLLLNGEHKEYLRNQGCIFPEGYDNWYLIYWKDETPNMIHCVFGVCRETL